MRAVATSTFSVLRGTGESSFGDETDTGTVVLSGVPMSVMEQRRQDANPVTGRADTVHFYTGRCSPALDVRAGDRLQDERTGAIYQVSSATQVANPVSQNDRRMDLERVA